MTLPRVFIDGEQGTTGLQIVSRLQARTDLRLITLPAGRRKDPLARAEALNGCEVAILCLPDEAAREAVGWIEEPSVRVIDASSAHRTADGWVYGLPELDASQPSRIRSARRISNPGCYPTGAIALLRPLVDAGLLPADHPLAIHAVSGYSGRGRAGVEQHEGPDAASAPAFQVYGLALQHKHVPEIRQHARLSRPPVFVPAYGGFRQGIVLTIALHLDTLPSGATAAGLRRALQAHHAGSRHVRVLGADESASLAHLDPRRHNGTDDMTLAVLGNEATGQVLLAAVFDNLGKGASGAAVQNLDLVLGV